MVKPEVHFEIAMALAPVPSARDPDRREAAEARVTTAAKTVMTGIAVHHRDRRPGRHEPVHLARRAVRLGSREIHFAIA